MAPRTAADTPRPTESSGSIAAPLTPGIWQLSHRDLRAYSRVSEGSGAGAAFELVTDVSFVWSFPAKSAFVTGTFSSWETTVPMVRSAGGDGVWVFTKALPPGDYQYKFIIDNVWRHAPDQPVVFDERGIINNVLSVTVEACGDSTCFCDRFFGGAGGEVTEGVESAIDAGTMTPKTMKRFQRNIGVAYRYVEREDYKSRPVRKTYMHTEIPDRPFDVTVVNVNNLPSSRTDVQDSEVRDGTISRVSSLEHIVVDNARLRYDPSIPVVEDAAYAATLNDQAGSLPHTALYRANALSSDPTELAYSVRARLSSPVLGFNPNECHEGIHLVDTNHCAVRVQERGLYKSVRGVLPIRHDGQSVYYEFFIFRQATGGGVCIGLSTHELPLNCLCGTRPNSIGFSSSGNLIRTVDGKETWTEFGADLESGCTVGCLVTLKNKQIERVGGTKTIVETNIEFSVNGESRGAIEYEFVGDLDVFPTLSLFAKRARVYSLFNGQDMIFASSLPEGEDILTLDGQIITRYVGNTPKSLGFASGEEPTSSGMSPGSDEHLRIVSRYDGQAES